MTPEQAIGWIVIGAMMIASIVFNLRAQSNLSKALKNMERIEQEIARVEDEEKGI